MNLTYVFELLPVRELDVTTCERDPGENHGFVPTAARTVPSLKQHVVETLLPAIEAAHGIGVYTSARSDLLEAELPLHAGRLAGSIQVNVGGEELVSQLLILARRTVARTFGSSDIGVSSPPDSTQMIVAVFVCAAGLLRKVVVYASPISVPRMVVPSGALHVACAIGPPRDRPHVKNIAWIRDRQDLELRSSQAMEGWPGVTCCDTLLCTETGDLLEGLVTNFFVIVDTSGDGAGCGYKVQTAPESDVLAGVSRRKVIDACRRLDIPVDVSCPNPLEASTWIGAFLTNSVRQVQNLDGVVCGPTNVWGLGTWEVFFAQQGGDGEQLGAKIIDHIAKHIT